MADVMLIEDEEDLAHATQEYLQVFGVSTTHHRSAEEALNALTAESPLVVLLDVGLPGMSGFALCSRIRSVLPRASIIFISARTTEADAILGLDLGADDYVTKPFSAEVLLAKVRRAIDRVKSTTMPDNTTANQDAVFDDSHLRVDTNAGRTWIDGTEIHLTAIEHLLLAHLVSRRGQVCTKREIIDAVWSDPFTSESTLTVHMRRLRTRIETDPDQPEYIRTVRGRGYLFEGAK